MVEFDNELEVIHNDTYNCYNDEIGCGYAMKGNPFNSRDKKEWDQEYGEPTHFEIDASREW